MIRVIFFGSSSFSLPFLEFLLEYTDLIYVVTTEDKPKGRGKKVQFNIVKEFAYSKGTKILTPLNLRDEEFISKIVDIKLDLIVAASYGKILPEEILKIPKLGAINIHPSLLPLYPGAEPIFWQIARGEEISGVTIFEMNTKIDKGEIILQESINISQNDSYEDVEKSLTILGVKLLKKVINIIETASYIPRRKQEDKKVFYARKLLSQDEKINWGKPSKEIINKIRAFFPKIGAYTTFNGKRVKIFKAKRVKLNGEDVKPGTIVIKERDIFVKTGDSFIGIDSLKPEGKKIITAFEFINGYLKNFDEPKFE